jgi:hypothetical protein
LIPDINLYMVKMANKAVIGIVPTFTLRRVDPKEVYDKYLKGCYAEMKFPKEKISLSISSTATNPTMSSSPDAGVFCSRLKNNTFQVIATSNSIPYSIYMNNGQNLPVGGECMYCRKKFETDALGIPTRMKEYRDSNNRLSLIFYMDDCSYCSFECAFAALKFYSNGQANVYDPLYMDSEQLLRYLYSIVYPNAGHLRESPDRRLHQRFNGPLEDDAFYSNKHAYIRTSNVILAPLKVQYSRT